jgi:hypothetical protein
VGTRNGSNANTAARAPEASDENGRTSSDIRLGLRLGWNMSKPLRRRTLALALLAVPLAAGAQSSTSLDFLKSIYEPYKQAGFKGQPYWETERFFATELAQAIQRDFQEAKKRKEVPTLDGDPFIDAQDWKIESLSYVSSISGEKAAGAVSFINLGTPKAVTLTMVKTPAGWRISDIVTANGSLRALYKLK